MRHLAVPLALLVAALVGPGCAGPAGSGAGAPGEAMRATAELPAVEGVLVWRDLRRLPAPAVARIRLLRLDGPNAAPAVLAEAVVPGPLASPQPFLLPYRPPVGPAPANGYGVAAMVTVYREVVFTSAVPARLSRLPPDAEETPVVVPLEPAWGTVAVDAR